MTVSKRAVPRPLTITLTCIVVLVVAQLSAVLVAGVVLIALALRPRAQAFTERERPARYGRILVCLGSGHLVAAANIAALIVAMPTIVQGLPATLAQLAFVFAAYLVACSAALRLAPAIGDRLGDVSTFALGLALSGVGVLLTADAGSPASLWFAVVVQGVGSGFAAGPVTTTIAEGLAPDQSTRRRTVFIVMAGIGVVLGLIIGGTLSAAGGWRLAFVALALIPIVAMVATRRLMPSLPAAATSRPLRLGLCLLSTAGWLMFLLANLQIGNRSPEAGLLLVFAIVLLACSATFAIGDSRRERPTGLLRLLSTGLPYAAWTEGWLLCAGCGVAAPVMFYLQIIQGHPPGLIAVLSCAVAVATVAGIVVARRLVRHFMAFPVMAIGLAAAGVALMTLSVSLGSIVGFWIAMACAGLGSGVAHGAAGHVIAEQRHEMSEATPTLALWAGSLGAVVVTAHIAQAVRIRAIGGDGDLSEPFVAALGIALVLIGVTTLLGACWAVFIGWFEYRRGNRVP